MFVLSDGKPQGRGYSGSAAAQHTKDMIEKARSTGVEVISLSVVSEVVWDNNNIYGRDYNVDVSQDNAVEELRKMVTDIAVSSR